MKLPTTVQRRAHMFSGFNHAMNRLQTHLNLNNTYVFNLIMLYNSHKHNANGSWLHIQVTYNAIILSVHIHYTMQYIQHANAKYKN